MADKSFTLMGYQIVEVLIETAFAGAKANTGRDGVASD
jgi:hypothetical protein